MDIFTANTRLACLKRNLLRSMLTNKVFKFDLEGEGFQLKSGKMSPIYIDLRECFGSPSLMKLSSECLLCSIKSSAAKFDAVVGVPYAALPYATSVSAELESPSIIIRKEAKSYGTKKLIEGKYAAGDTVIIIEDVVTTGGSIKTVVETLRAEGLLVSEVFCLLDRDQGGKAKLLEDGITLHSLLDMKTILSFVKSIGIADDNQLKKIIDALDLGYSSVDQYVIALDPEDITRLPHVDTPRQSLSERAQATESTFTRRIFQMMQTKKSNLCIALDYTETKKILEITEAIGPFVIAIKIHSDAIVDFSLDFAHQLVELADRHDFLLFEDRKFGDTGNTTSLQLNGSHAIANWADIVTVHAVQGSDSISTVFRNVINDKQSRLKGILLIAELSTKASLTQLPNYTKKVVEIGEQHSDVVCGFICQTRVSSKPGMLHWTPGVNLSSTSDKTGQQWRGVTDALEKEQNDMIIVGRGVTESPDPVAAIQHYKTTAWNIMKE